MIVRFIGSDGSLGYRTGQKYALDVRTDWTGTRPSILRPHACPYGSWDAFWRNWELVPLRELQTQQGRGSGR